MGVVGHDSNPLIISASKKAIPQRFDSSFIAMTRTAKTVLEMTGSLLLL
jgi:hypothetical protein